MTERTLRLPSLAKGLSARLLVMTTVFVMLAEVLIFVPSVARFRVTYLEERIASAHLAILALEATPDNMVSAEMEAELLDHVGAHSVALRAPGKGKLMLMRETPRTVDVSYDLRTAGPLQHIEAAFASLLGPGDRLLRVVGTSPKNPDAMVEVVIEERPLRRAMVSFAERILVLSLVISLMTAALVYLALHLLLVRPMRRLTESMTRFRKDPEDLSNHIAPSDRTDEIGVAEHELASMQARLTAALQQKTRLAALGIAVTKINHDLRNILASARLVSDRLAASEDPEVRRSVPTLVKTIDRAVNLCAQTLRFTREGPSQLELTRFDLGELVAEIAGDLAAEREGAEPPGTVINRLPAGLKIEADRDQLHRIFANLVRNALEAGAGQVAVAAEQSGTTLAITVADDGPGLLPRAQEHIFQPFAGTAKAGSSGLGLAIARDLVRAHGGEIRLERSTAEGTTFRIELPRRSGHAASKQTPARRAAG